MLGWAGAVGCAALGTALGLWLRERRFLRYRTLEAYMEALGRMQLLLEQERPSLPDLLCLCASYVPHGAGREEAAGRLMRASENLLRDPLAGLSDAYVHACLQIPIAWEQTEERSVLENLFSQLGNGSAIMRQQSVISCMKRLKPIAESARAEAEKSGILCAQIGALLGLMAGIALW